MSYKNSIKLMFSNFSLVWKQLAYLLVVFVISALISVAISMPTIELLRNEGFFSHAKDLLEAVYINPSLINQTISEILTSFFTIIWSHAAGYIVSFIGFILSAIVLPAFLIGLGEYAVCFVSSKKLSSNVKLGFSSSLLTNAKDASRYSLYRLLIGAVTDLIILGFLLVYLKLASGIILTIVLLLVFMAILVFLRSFKLTLLGLIVSKMIEEDKSIKRSQDELIKLSARAFWRSFSNAVIVVLTIIALNLFAGVFTILAGLIVTIPLSMVFKCIFMITNYYTISGKKYYLNENLIIEPKILDEKGKLNS